MKLVSVFVMLLLVMATLSMAVDQNAPPPKSQAEEGEAAQVKSSGAIPTLSEWGMIIFGVALAGWMAWMVLRRKQKATIGF